MKTTLQRLNDEAEKIHKLQAWLEKHAPNITNFSSYSAADKLYCSANCYDWNRSEVLKEAADTFSKEGWFAKVEGKELNWEKELDGVIIAINNAQELPSPPVRPVLPKDWPIQLTETSSL